MCCFVLEMRSSPPYTGGSGITNSNNAPHSEQAKIDTKLVMDGKVVQAPDATCSFAKDSAASKAAVAINLPETPTGIKEQSEHVMGNL